MGHFRQKEQPGQRQDQAELKGQEGTSLVFQWLRICLPVHGTRAQSRVGSIPLASEQLTLHAATTEPTYLEPAGREATTTRSVDRS